jgi:DHA2 family multidrug resistance protein
MGESLGEAGRLAPDVVTALATRIGATTSDSTHALLMAQGELARVVGRMSLTLAFDDVFRMMAWLFIAALLLVPFCRAAPINAPAPAASTPTEAH